MSSEGDQHNTEGGQAPSDVADTTGNTGKGSLTFCKEFQLEASSNEELEELCFTHLADKAAASEEGHAVVGSGSSVAEVSCASSTCSLVGNLSDSGSTQGKKGTTVPADRGISDQINAKLLKRTISRHGRSSQRWAADPLSHSAIRLTTGCVPIVKDGKVLMVSASSKPAWIFPKGGWENDEKIEESALRECYEEAGIIGILGPRLAEVQYETRKARKRRLETEEMLKLKRGKGETTPQTSDHKDKATPKLSEKSESKSDGISSTTDCPGSAPAVMIDASVVKERAVNAALDAAPVSDEALSTMRGAMPRGASGSAKRHTDETSSLQSDASAYSQVRMVLFPLYVTTVKNEWPEKGRLRRAVPIDDAIKILEARPELQAALIEVKKRGLHLLDSNKPIQEGTLPSDSNII